MYIKNNLFNLLKLRSLKLATARSQGRGCSELGIQRWSEILNITTIRPKKQKQNKTNVNEIFQLNCFLKLSLKLSTDQYIFF